MAHRDSVQKDGIKDNAMLSDIGLDIHKYSQYTAIINIKDRIYTQLMLREVKKGSTKADWNKVLDLLNYFISRYERKREEFLDV